MFEIQAKKLDTEGRFRYEISYNGRKLGRVESELVVGKRGVYHGRTLELFDNVGRSFALTSSLEQALDRFAERLES